MSRVSTGTVTVANGETLVTDWDGAGGIVLSEITAPIDSPVVIEGVANFIASRVSTTSFELALPHAGAGGAGLGCAISAMTPAETQVGTLNARTARVIQELSVLDANGRGLFYNLIGVTGAGDPGPGNMAFNNVDPALVSALYLDVLDANAGGRDVSALVGYWGAGTVLIARSLATANFAAFSVETVATHAGWREVLVAPIGSSGTLAAEPLAVEWVPLREGLSISRAGTFAGRSAFDSAAPPFTYASTDGAAGAGGPTVLYSKNTAAAADWSPAVSFQGPIGPPGPPPNLSGGAVTTLSPGTPAAATFAGTSPNYTLNLGLPRGATGWTIEPATINDGDRRVQQIAGFIGGEGAPPSGAGLYIGPAGLVADIAEAKDIRGGIGPVGPRGVDWQGAWSTGASFVVDAVVTDNDADDKPAAWIATAPSTNKRPRDNPSFWDLFPGSFATTLNDGLWGETVTTYTNDGVWGT